VVLAGVKRTARRHMLDILPDTQTRTNKFVPRNAVYLLAAAFICSLATRWGWVRKSLRFVRARPMGKFRGGLIDMAGSHMAI
jgi:hypothetical protein